MSTAPDRSLFRMRAMVEADLPRVLAIERSAYAQPWSEGIFRDCLRVGYQCRICELDGRAVGHAVLSIAAGEAHLLNLCIDPDHQRRGLGRRALERVIEEASTAGAETLFLEVRVSNRPAVRLYLSMGFNEIGLRAGYYPAEDGRREDAFVFARALLT